jgi:type II restriction enzyme
MEILREGNTSWIINKHSSNFDLLIIYLKLLKGKKEINNDIIIEYLENLKIQGLYNPRYDEINITTFKNKVTELAFYMFGFKHENKFFLSPLGNLLLKHINDKLKIRQIFLSMLWGFQFQHPENNTSYEFKIFPFRLFYKLMSDKRLSNYIETIEALYFLYFIKEINLSDYEELVSEIKEFRKLTNTEKIIKLFSTNVGRQNIINKEDSDIANEMFWANKVHEWGYYFIKFLNESGVVNIENGELIYRLRHFSNTAKVKTYRKINQTRYTIPTELNFLVEQLEYNYPFYSKPILNDNQSLLEFKTNVYSFIPNFLLKALNETGYDYTIFDKIINNELIDFEDLVGSSVQSDRFNDFEFYIKDSFNLFSDVSATRISGAGNTDIECIYKPISEKFNVEAKTRKNQLVEVSISRLQKHREKNGAKYTIIITSKYSIGALTDIKLTNNTILQSRIFANYMFNIMNTDDKSYNELRNIIKNNLGKSSSSDLAKYNFDKFSTTIN